jgi:undecaprenyl-diphosphatase
MKTSRALILANLISLLFFILLIIGLFYNSSLIQLDSQISSFMQSIKNNFLTVFFKAISFIFDIKIIVILSLIFSVYLWINSSKIEAVFFMLTISISGGLLYLLKELIQRARPLNAIVSETNYSFPSGHALTSVVFFGLLIYLISK